MSRQIPRSLKRKFMEHSTRPCWGCFDTLYRRSCVRIMGLFYADSELGSVFGVSDRTIRHDREVLNIPKYGRQMNDFERIRPAA